MAESFFATLECEVIQQSRFQTRSEARQAVFSFIEGWLQHPAAALRLRASLTPGIRGRVPLVTQT